MARRKSEKLIIAVKMDLPTGANAKMAMEFLRFAINQAKENTHEHEVMANVDFTVALQRRITDYA